MLDAGILVINAKISALMDEHNNLVADNFRLRQTLTNIRTVSIRELHLNYIQDGSPGLSMEEGMKMAEMLESVKVLALNALEKEAP
jgi:hypothetical protein